jgi:hypothetical protein
MRVAAVKPHLGCQLIMQQSGDLLVALVEVDAAPRISWCFPAWEIDATGVNILASRVQLVGDDEPSSSPSFVFSRWNGMWLYSLSRARKPADVVHENVSRFAIVLGSTTFDPERNHALLVVLLRAFEAEGGSPLALLQRVLSVSTKGSASAPGGADFVASRFDPLAACLACPFAATLRRIGAEGAATLWAAMTLRARVVVHGEELGEVLELVRTLPLFAWQRSRWEVLRPICTLDHPEELDELNTSGSFVAGFTDPRVLDKTGLYDVLVDGKAGEVRVSPGAAYLKPPALVAREVTKALAQGAAAAEKRGGGGAAERLIAEALAEKTVALLGLSHEGKVEGEDGVFLARLVEAEGIGA